MRCKVTVDTSHYPKEVPWELPEGWCWTTIGDVFIHNTGKALNSADREGRLLSYITTSNLYWDRFELSTLKKMLFTEDELEKCTARKGDLLVCEGGDIGRAAIWNQDYEIRIQNHIHKLRGLGGVNHRLFMFWLMYMKEEGMIGGKGIGLMGLSSREFDKLLIPLPPLCEQSHLVDRIDGLFSVVSRIEKTETVLFETVSVAKSRILDLAIHGKLVPQDSSDEPAIELLKHINPAFKPSHNLHYEGDLPNRWSIIRLGDVIDVISGTSYQKTDIVPTDSGIRILRGGNIQNGMIVLCEDDVFVNHRLSDKHLSLYRGDIALVASTGSRELIGKAAIAKRDYQNTQIGAFLRIIRPKATELSDYLGILFQSDYYKKHIQEAAKGTNINNIKTSYLTEFVVPLPPIKEQQRIIEKVNALFLILNHMADLSDC